MKKIPKAKRRKSKTLQKGTIGMFFTMIVLVLLIAGAYTFVGGAPKSHSTTTGDAVIIVTPTPESSKKSLQLETFGYVTITPTLVPAKPKGPQKSCGPEDDNGIKVPADCRCLDASVTCTNGQPYDDNGKPLTGMIGDPPVVVSTLCGSYLAPGDGRYCVAKPVIYLYPQHMQFVSISVASTGHIVMSDPLYPQGGWKQVLAHPDGSLLYQGRQYSELFYETDVTTFEKPTKGILIPKKNLQDSLKSILSQLGLNNNEKEEFLMFWLPKLQHFTQPYIYFSLLDASVKNNIDNVTITPQPDTQIAFIAYFKPVTDISAYDTSLVLPQKPVRKGFVSVEWGGVIDTKN